MSEALKGAAKDRSALIWKDRDSQKLALIADMDAKFIYVPKAWVRGILKVRIAKVMVNLIFKSLDGELDEVEVVRKNQLLNTLQAIQSDKTDFIQTLLTKLDN